MGSLLGDRALLLGGSMAALLTARVLSEHYKEVVLVDRDQLTGVTGPRRGVPHGRHAHGLLGRGQQIFERQFPGLQAEMWAAGVEPGDVNADIRWYFNGRRLKPGRSGLVSIPATRPVLEYHLRGRVQGIDNVVIRERHDILGITSTSDGSRITGARVRAQDGDAEEVIDADLVIDCTGRGSRTPAWLEELGYERPAEDRVKIGLAYTTRHYRLRSDPFGSDIAIIPVATPAIPRGAFFYKLPGDGSRIELSLTGILGDHPPTDPVGFLEFVRSLPVPTIYESIKAAEPIDEPVMHQFPASVRRRYERLTRFPEGYLLLGDSVCSFNPVYGQGMTAAGLESLTLQRHLRAGAVPAGARFFRDVARDIDAPWEVSAGADLGYAGVQGRRTPKVLIANAYMSRLQRAAVHDASLTNAFLRTAALVDPPQRLFRPGTMLRVLRPQPAATFKLAGLAASDAEAFQAVTSRLSPDFDANVRFAMAPYLADPPEVLLARWREEKAAAEKALAAVPEGQPVPWLVRPLLAPVLAPVLAAAGMMELFGHGQDIADALGVQRKWTDRMGHLVAFAVRVWDFGYQARGLTAPQTEFRFELTAPSGHVWTFGPKAATNRITGPAADFCLLVTRRRHRADLALTATGGDAQQWLDIAQAYRGPAGPGRAPGQFKN